MKNFIFENAKANHQMNEAWMEEYNNKQQAEQELIESEHERLYNLKDRRQKLRDVFAEYKIFVEDTLFQYVIEDLMSVALDESEMDDVDKAIKSNLVKQYIKENGHAQNILLRGAGKTYVIDTIRDVIKEAEDEIVDKADPESPETLSIDKEDIAKVMDKLNNEENFDDVKQAIAVRVTSAEDAFINSNRAEKEAMQEIIQQGQDKINKANASEDMDDATKEAIAQEAARVSKRKMTALRENKKRSIFDEMVHRFAESCMKKEGLAANYLTESGKLNSDRVVMTVKTMYTLMEALQTTKFEIIDDKYIEDVLKSM